ncbi:rhodanese-like domain-containing protein [Acuticoccus sp. M5D2P5]|uniref:rhodanese-like domain-containing protein n=1 Tax=Acuticoccus kalidii TaxID=2910977 RepID=UPI001F34B6C3|nr:rhodanese-like domain-containing protein [Acuticoccus kalidii]MCF3935971.1 rhodanese-like domain-containing protein [Acuticoccus kalidii]
MSTTSDTPVSDATPGETYAALKSDPRARLVDVRTRAEWTYVGLPDLSETESDPVLIEWQTFPTMDVQPQFGAALSETCPDRSAPLYFLCRSGVRSLAAAKLANSMGYERCYNIQDGFEGPPDGNGHRGQRAGWKASNLPWRQS